MLSKIFAVQGEAAAVIISDQYKKLIATLSKNLIFEDCCCASQLLQVDKSQAS